MLRILSAAAILAATTLGLASPPPPAELPASGDAIAVEINGVKITLADMEQRRPAAMFQARNNYYEAARRTLEEYVQEYLLEQEARKENLTVPQLLERHVNSVIAKDPSEETFKVYYETADTTEPYESVRVKIADAIRERRIAKAKAAYLESIRSRATVAFRLAAPRAPIAPPATPARGPVNARVTVTEYADYECPFCQQIQPTIEKLEAEFKGKIAFTYKDFPLPMHANAQKAAEASRCAQAQSKYWEYHDMLAANKGLDLAALKAYARQLKLDSPRFDKCLDSGETADAVKAQAAEAAALGLQGTPTFFINGRYISGSLTYERLRGFILEELAAGQAEPSPSGAGGRE
jgi:predicted DsbA family dithiol-disulfide isomerase